MSANVVKIFGLSAFAFFIACYDSAFDHYLYKYKRKKVSNNFAITPITSELYKDGTPRMRDTCLKCSYNHRYFLSKLT